MTILKDEIVRAGLGTHILTDTDLEVLLGGTPAARYGLVNKALKKSELIRIRRGLYVLADQYRQNKLSKFYIASRIVSHSYISLESALSYHGWIPERVELVTSVTLGRSKKLNTQFGGFHFYSIPANEYEYLTGVSRSEEITNEPFFIASPLRALTDYVYFKKIVWRGLSDLTESLRIDVENFHSLKENEFIEIKRVYHSKRVLKFIECLKQELIND